MKKKNLFVVCNVLAVCMTGCGQLRETAQDTTVEKLPVTPLPVSTSAQNDTALKTAENSSPMFSGFVSAGNQEYIILHSSADENSGSVARMYTGEDIEIYEMGDQWCYVKYGDLTGYISKDGVSLSKPETTASGSAGSPAEPAPAATEAPVVAAEAPVVNNEINNTISIVLKYDADGIALPTSYQNAGYVAYDSKRNAYCSTTSCYIYKTASTSGPKREADMLYQGDPVTVYGTYDGFYYIGTDSGSGYELKGYVQTKYITIGTPPASDKKNYSATQGYVSVGSCNVRSSPSKADDSNVIGTLTQGATFTVNSFDGYWYYINYSGGSGYVSHKMVTVY